MAQGHNRATVSATGLGFILTRGNKTLIVSFSRSDDKAKRGIRRNMENGNVLIGTDGPNARFLMPTLLLAGYSVRLNYTIF